jgi:hypothetical protein
VQKL